MGFLIGMPACYTGLGEASGSAAEDGDDDGDDASGAMVFDAWDEDLSMVPMGGLRRLSVAEYDATLHDLLGDDSRSGDLRLPYDQLSPFDNDYTVQIPSQALVEGLDDLAAQAAARVLADPEKREALLGCEPKAVDDVACFEHFLRTFGRRALRRPLADDEIERAMGLLKSAQDANDFDVAVDSALRMFLQHPEFIYRVEIGSPTDEPGVFRLNDWELATRLSYLLWGSAPSDELLDRADAGRLRTSADLREAAVDMLQDPRAVARIDRFHALWMGYETLPHPQELAQAMREETAALIRRIIFDERRPWQDLLRSEETYISDFLAAHYGLDPVGSDDPLWVSYGDSGRRGLLSHGTFLALGETDGGDTSPVMRGLLIRTRLFCTEIPPPPPDLGVDADEPPPVSEDALCKWDRYARHREEGTCAACHQLMDPVGFGLEHYDAAGRFRTHDWHPETGEILETCPIEGQGELVGVGTFSGPAELGELMLQSPQVTRCVAEQLYRFTHGRYELDIHDHNLITRIAGEGGTDDFRFDELLLDVVSDPTFLFRRLPDSEQ